MTKRLIEIDDGLLDAAKAALGTAGITETVIASLQKSVADEAYAERLARINRLGIAAAAATKDLLNEEVMRGAWR